MKNFLIATALASLLPAGILVGMEAPFPRQAYLFGLGLSLLHGLAATVINRLAIGSDTSRFMRRAALGHGCRLAIISGMVSGAVLSGMPDTDALVITVFCGYFVFTLSEIALRYRAMYSARPIVSNAESFDEN